MSDKSNAEKVSLSRRKLLGSVATLGAAGVLGGAGTTAFFSDTEEFTNNSLTAGELDLKIAWEEHYSDWSPDELNGIPDGNVTMTDRVVFGSTRVPGLEFNTSGDLEQWKANTLVEAGGSLACPDPPGVTDGDAPPRKLVAIDDVKPGDEGEVTFGLRLCDNDGYVWLDGRLRDESEGGSTEPERVDPQEADGRVELTDAIQTVLWYDDDADNVYEPERGDADQELDCALVLDTSQNLTDDEFEEVIEATRGAVNGLVNSLGTDQEQIAIGLVSTGGGATLEQDLTFDGERIADAGNILDRIENDGQGGPNDLEGGIRQAHEELLIGDQFDDPAGDPDEWPEEEDENTGDPAEPPRLIEDGPRRGVPKIMLVLNGSPPQVDSDGNAEGGPPWGDALPSDNAAAARSDDPPVQIVTAGLGDTLTNPDLRGLMADLASSSSSSEPLAFLDPDTTLGTKLRTALEVLGSEECLFRGSLRELLDVLSSPGSNGVPGIPLDGNRITAFDEVTGTDIDGDGSPEEGFAPGAGDADGRDCFAGSRDHHLGLTWFLPFDHANEIQTDSVSFDLGFYTEQCRHNDGSGQVSHRSSEVTVTATDAAAGVTTSHAVVVTVGDELAGSNLTDLVVDYPSGFDVSAVAPTDVSGVNYDVDPSFDGALPQILPEVTATDASDDGTRLSMEIANGPPFAAMESFSVTYGDVENAPETGTHEVVVRSSGTEIGSGLQRLG